MRLGENIYRLRTAKGMSQGDLAEALQVSRQSVSKWETGGATPDLEKLVKMSALFGVSLDELVKGAEQGGPAGREEGPASPPPQAPPEPGVTYVRWAEPAFPPRKVAGLVLYGLALLVVILCGLLGGMLAGLLFSLPLWACGVICFVFRKRVGLWCGWAVFFLADVYLRYATGVTWGSFFAALRGLVQNTVAGVVSAALLLILLALIVCTVRSYRDRALEPTKRVKTRLICLGAVLAALCLPWSPAAIAQQYVTDGQSLHAFARVFQVVSIALQWGKIVLTCRLLIDALAVWRWKRARSSAG